MTRLFRISPVVPSPSDCAILCASWLSPSRIPLCFGILMYMGDNFGATSNKSIDPRGVQVKRVEVGVASLRVKFSGPGFFAGNQTKFIVGVRNGRRYAQLRSSSTFHHFSSIILVACCCRPACLRLNIIQKYYARSIGFAIPRSDGWRVGWRI